MRWSGYSGAASSGLRARSIAFPVHQRALHVVFPLLGAIVLGLLLSPTPGPAQSVHGRILDGTSGSAMPGVILSVLDSRGAPVAAVLSDSLGRYHVQVARHGRYRLRADMVGHVSRLSAEIALLDDNPVEFDFEFERRAQPLPVISVVGTRRCERSRKRGPAAVALWEEVRKALDATRLAEPAALMRVGLLQYERELDPVTLAVRRSRSWMDAGVGQQPFGSLPAETLAANGYVQASAGGTWYYAPDARTLLSESFLEAHCFQPHPGGDSLPGMVGLAFEPVARRKKADVRGVLWLDQQTAELRFLEYSYTGLPRQLDDREYGGRLEFARLESGAWVIRSWSIRMPRVVRRMRYRQSPVLELGVSPRLTPISEEVVAGIIERGGELARHAPVGAHGARSGISYIRGEVFDSMSRRPLHGADIVVELPDVAGAGWRVRTDSLGRFRIDSLGEGMYLLRASHPRLDTLGASLPPMAVTLASDEGVTVAFYTSHGQDSSAARDSAGGVAPTASGSAPSAPPPSVAAPAPSGARPAGRGAERIKGTVVGPAGRPIAGAEIREPSSEATTRTSEDGRFVLAGISPGRVLVEARAVGYLPIRRVAEVVAGTPYIANFRLVQVAQPLDTVAIVGKADRYRTGFAERRRRAAGGRFVTREMIDASTSRRISELLSTIPGVRIRKSGSVSVVELAGRGTRTLSPRGCPVSWVLDGMPYEPASFGIDGEIGLDDVESIEVYDAATAPIQMSRFGATCGVVLLWTREHTVAR